MKASWNWLTDYVDVKAAVAEAAGRLTMSGLIVENLEETADDFVLEVEITSNRPDWLSHLGIAREIAALYGLAVRIPEVKLAEGKSGVQADAALEVPAGDLCPLYTGRVIKGVKVGPSPSWLKSKIESVGLRSVNNVVDLTNFVLYECGQPLHAFDLAKLGGHKVVVRRAGQGEATKLIDGTKHTLRETDLVIADAARPIALAGIMGGLETEIDERTTDVFLESAKFDQYSIRLTSKRLGVSSDASYRFERGVDLDTVDWASRRCAALIVEVAGGTLSRGALGVGQGSTPPRKLTLRMGRMAHVLGTEVPAADAKSILSALGFGVEEPGDGALAVAIPSFRGDVKEEVDLIEEVARIYGYDRIPVTTGLRIAAGARSSRERVTETVDSVLTACGFYGCVSFSLVSGDFHRNYSPWTNRPPLYIENRAGQENAFVRTSLIPSLLAVRKTNEDHKVARADVYEVAHVYLPSSDELPYQPLVAAAVADDDFPALKGVIQKMLTELGGEAAAFLPADYGFLTPGRAAKILVGGRAIGHIGQLSEAVRREVDLREPVCVAEVDLSVFESMPVMAKAYVPLQRLPAVERDIAVVLRDDISWADVLDCILKSRARNLESASFASVYRGKPIPDGQKSIACHLVFRAAERTLTGEEADEATDGIVAALGERFGARLR